MSKFTNWLWGVEESTQQMQQGKPSRIFSGIGSDYATWNALVQGAYAGGKASRTEAMQVPAVKRARDLICQPAYWPIHSINGEYERVDRPLLDQPESLNGYVRSVTMAKTIEDLFYDAASLWLVIQRDYSGFPAAVQHIEFGLWVQDSETGEIRVNGRRVDTADLILFTSPNAPILNAAGPSIIASNRLRTTAAMYTEHPEMSEYFQATDGQAPDETEIENFLTGYQAARQQRTIGFIPEGVERHEVNRMTAEEIQLISAREFEVLEISRLTGIDPDWLGVNTTTRTYTNSQDSRRHFVDFVCAPYIRCIEERLSLGDVTPRGQRVLFNYDGFLRANTTDRYSAHKVGLDAGFLTLEEVREMENRPPLPEQPKPEPAAVPEPTSEEVEPTDE